MYKIIVFIFLILLLVGCNPTSIDKRGYNEDSAVLTIVAAGNTQGYHMISRSEYPEENPFHVINDLSLAPDIFLFAAEGVFSLKFSLSNCKRYRLQSKFISPPDFLNFIPKENFTVTSLANNHILDCDIQGLVQTMSNFKEQKILTVGAGENTMEACKPLILKIKGHNLAFLGYLDIYHEQFYADIKKAGVASIAQCNAFDQIKELKKKADLIIIMLHSHPYLSNWKDRPDPAIEQKVQRLLDAGADLVIGSGIHVTQGIMVKNNKIALLSLGNFIFHTDYQMPQKASNTILAKFIITSDKIKLEIIPLIINDSGIPHIPSNDKAMTIMRDLAILSSDLGTKIEILEGKGYIEIAR